ncbi:MAG: hypothetical protein JF593_04540 [Novosphingobium sp.]|nr:hypothetical protein [Novosphingobium sp.]
MTRRLNLSLLVLLVLIGGPFYWLLLDNRPADAAPQPISIAELRSLAAAIPGPGPSGIEAELVAWHRVPGDLVAAGSGLKRRLIGVLAFRLPVQGRGPIVIDSGLTPAAARALHMEAYIQSRQELVDAALRSASTILVTGEQPEQLSGLLAQAAIAPGVLQRARFNPLQLPPAPLASALPWPRGLALPRPTLDQGRPQAVAPGVVAIPAPSRTPGSQMIFVRLADGREYLFTGPIATLDQNWDPLRAPSHLLGLVSAVGDGRAVASWLRTIRALKNEDPQLTIIAGHDSDAIAWTKGHLGVQTHFAAGTD